MSVASQGEFRLLDPRVLTFSKSAAQAERRKHFDEALLKDMIASVKEKGVLQPIVVRPHQPTGGFEIVAGERRVIAARKAGQELVPAMVHELTEEQALDVQLIENLQREGLHPLVEAEGYETLRKAGISIKEIADRLGKSQSYVYKRIELSACGAELRAAFYQNKIDASKALLISRLPAALQSKALEDLAEEEQNYYGDGVQMSYREAEQFIRQNFMLRLDQAEFDTADPNLVPAAGACGKCPKNTACQGALFADISKDALCTDSACHKAKTTAAGAKTIEAAKKNERPVIDGKDAEKALRNARYQQPEGKVYAGGKWKSFEELLGKQLQEATVVVVNPESGVVQELVDSSAAKKLIEKKGIKIGSPGASTMRRSQADIDKEKAEEAKLEAEFKFLAAVVKAIHGKAPKPFTEDELSKLTDLYSSNAYGVDEVLEQVYGKGKEPRPDKLNAAGLLRLIRTYMLAEHIEDGDKGVVLLAAKRHGVNVEKIKADLQPKPAPAAATPKKKAAKKK